MTGGWFVIGAYADANEYYPIRAGRPPGGVQAAAAFPMVDQRSVERVCMERSVWAGRSPTPASTTRSVWARRVWSALRRVCVGAACA
jgi:hypothetical protein